ncbi:MULTISPECIES: hypothetical protein [Enterococcus]|uniref:hypothetical protein n=1 Tax=Enterococcus TaxID=1350 RepID=UPI00065DF4B0|nr:MULTISPECIES: hypothetical protein [Enterococcus]KAF1304757.1 DUF2187 domain-containing protein [Enterococcus sp. JM9B]
MSEALVTFKWKHRLFKGRIEKEYENSFLINVAEPSCEEITEKFANRLIVSKKDCEPSPILP